MANRPSATNCAWHLNDVKAFHTLSYLQTTRIGEVHSPSNRKARNDDRLPQIGVTRILCDYCATTTASVESDGGYCCAFRSGRSNGMASRAAMACAQTSSTSVD